MAAPRRGRRPAVPIRGPVYPSTCSAALSSPHGIGDPDFLRWVRGSAPTSSRIRSSPSTPGRGSDCGISRPCIMTCGTAISPPSEPRDVDTPPRTHRRGRANHEERLRVLVRSPNGTALFPIEERRPPSDLRGEQAWPTQPFPAAARALRAAVPEGVPTSLSQSALARYDGAGSSRAEQRREHRAPGFDGGGEWGGAAVDPERRCL